MKVVLVILGIIAYLIIGAIIAHAGDLYFGTDFEEDASNIGIAAIWPVLLLGLILYGAWQCINGFAACIVDVCVELVKHIRERNKRELE